MTVFDLIDQHLGLTRDARADVHFMAYSVAERGVTESPTQDLQLFPELTFARELREKLFWLYKAEAKLTNSLPNLGIFTIFKVCKEHFFLS